MIKSLSRYFTGKYSRHEKILRQFDGLVQKINTLEPEYTLLSDNQLRQKTQDFKERYQRGESLDSLLPEAFATVREASQRVLGMRHFDVQLKGGVALHRGMISEMKTGEGKTLVATLPLYLNALTGQGVHLVTVNDYLAQRDSMHMGHIYEFLGLSIGCIIQDLTTQQRKEAYHCDITYGTNNEFGFDYLRDNMKFDRQEMCQRPFYYAIVDEVDSILIDEARTPLIISGPAENSSDLYGKVNEVVLRLVPEDYEKEEKTKSISFTDLGYEKIEKMVKSEGLMKGEELFQPINLMLVHHLNQALKAQKIFQRDVDYIVKDDKVVIIDEFTGRMMKGRRYSDGLHQALEAKEHVDVEVENQTLASITFQNYFRMYPKLAGMTGTAVTEATEFEEIYKLPVLLIPTNTVIARHDMDDEIFRTFDQKKNAIVQQVKECHARNQPVLVGTASIESSEVFAHALKAAGVPCNVLNARHHEREAFIIAEAGVPGAVTIATNMAGRGTDIKLGGNVDVQLAKELEGVESIEERQRIERKVREHIADQAKIACEAGGLFVLGTERHESRRIDNQLRGRSGRQGDPGASKFFISLEDDLMRIFGPNLKLASYSLKRNEEKENEPITHPWLSRTIEKAQQRVEAQHFDTRKHLLKYADVLNAQRTAVYDERYRLMDLKESDVHLQEMSRQTINDLLYEYAESQKSFEKWDIEKLKESFHRIFGLDIPLEGWVKEGRSVGKISQNLYEMVIHKFEDIKKKLGEETWKRVEKMTLLRMLDQVWIAHLNAMEHLRSGIYLQAYGQKDPLNEYKHEAFIMFKGMTTQWHQSFLSFVFNFDPLKYPPIQDDLDLESLSYQHPSEEESESHKGSGNLLHAFLKHIEEKEDPPLSRNALCFCGSGKRYKHCHGSLQA
jgi:preprotein translocase subunit SecA